MHLGTPATWDALAAAAGSAGTSAAPLSCSRSGSVDSATAYTDSAIADSFGAAPPAFAKAPATAAAPVVADALGDPSKFRRHADEGDPAAAGPSWAG